MLSIPQAHNLVTNWSTKSPTCKTRGKAPKEVSGIQAWLQQHGQFLMHSHCGCTRAPSHFSVPTPSVLKLSELPHARTNLLQMHQRCDRFTLLLELNLWKTKFFTGGG